MHLKLLQRFLTVGFFRQLDCSVVATQAEGNGKAGARHTPHLNDLSCGAAHADGAGTGTARVIEHGGADFSLARGKVNGHAMARMAKEVIGEL